MPPVTGRAQVGPGEGESHHGEGTGLTSRGEGERSSLPMDGLATPSAPDLSEFRILTVIELQAARDALIDELRSGHLVQEAVAAVFALLLEE